MCTALHPHMLCEEAFYPVKAFPHSGYSVSTSWLMQPGTETLFLSGEFSFPSSLINNALLCCCVREIRQESNLFPELRNNIS